MNAANFSSEVEILENITNLIRSFDSFLFFDRSSQKIRVQKSAMEKIRRKKQQPSETVGC